MLLILSIVFTTSIFTIFSDNDEKERR